MKPRDKMQVALPRATVSLSSSQIFLLVTFELLASTGPDACRNQSETRTGCGVTGGHAGRTSGCQVSCY